MHIRHILQFSGLTLGLAFGHAAHAEGSLQAYLGNTSAAAQWRIAPGQLFNGVAALDGMARITFSNHKGSWLCSGALVQGGSSVLTAAHCADNFTSMTVQLGWSNGTAAETFTLTQADAYVHPDWQGFNTSVDAGSDIAVIKLSSVAKSAPGYKLSTSNDVGKTYLFAGYGESSIGSSNTAANLSDMRYGHYGFNTFDIDSQSFNQSASEALGNGWAEFDPAYYAPGLTYMSDYDHANGNPDNNSLQRIAQATGADWSSDAGQGSNEALIVPGDSGSGALVWNGQEWVLSGIASWGWQGSDVCPSFDLLQCDVGNNNLASYGDLSGHTAVSSHVQWIERVTAVPEPHTYALLLAGMGMLGRMVRRRQA